VNCAVRWNTVRWAACPAITGIAWMPEAPVPMTATRLPVKSTGSRGQFPVCRLSPPKLSAPGNAGWFAVDRQPTAVTTYLAVAWCPCAVRSVQRPAASSYSTAVTSAPKVKSLRRSSRSATSSR